MVTAVRITRAERVEQIRRLASYGLTYQEVADRLGVSRSNVREMLNDPDGTKVAARRERYAGRCQQCGAKTTGCNGAVKAPTQCARCSIPERLWTLETVFAAFREFDRVYGRPPAVTDASEAHARLSGQAGRARACRVVLPSPNTTTILELGGWQEALKAAGLNPTPPGLYERTPEIRAKMSASHRERHSRILAHDLDRLVERLPPTFGIREIGVTRGCCYERAFTWRNRLVEAGLVRLLVPQSSFLPGRGTDPAVYGLVSPATEGAAAA